MKIVSTKKGRIIKETITGYLCIAPMLVALFVFTFYPIFQSFFDSFWDYRGFERVNFGIHNYVNAFKDPKFWIAWKQTFTIGLISLPLNMVAGLVVALIVNSKYKGMYWLRAVWYLPVVIPAVAGTMIWGCVFDPKYGLGNQIFQMVGLPKSQFFQSGDSSMQTYILYQLFGAASGMVLWVSALRSVPHECYEAAKLDGASYMRTLFSITIPLITPYLLYMFITALCGKLSDFGPYLFVGYNGGDGNKLLLYGLLTYKEAYIDFNFGYASALAWLQAVVIAALSLLTFKSSKKWVQY